MKDLYSSVLLATAIAPAVLSADTASVAVDLLGHNSAIISLSVGAGGIAFTNTNKVEFVLTHSDDDTTYTPVIDADMLGVTGVTAGIIKALVAAHADPTVSRFGYKGGKRYLKLLADFSGTHEAGTPICANIILGHGDSNPQPAQS